MVTRRLAVLWLAILALFVLPMAGCGPSQATAVDQTNAPTGGATPPVSANAQPTNSAPTLDELYAISDTWACVSQEAMYKVDLAPGTGQFMYTIVTNQGDDIRGLTADVIESGKGKVIRSDIEGLSKDKVIRLSLLNGRLTVSPPNVTVLPVIDYDYRSC